MKCSSLATLSTGVETDRFAQRPGGLERRFRLRREHDEVDAADRLLVRRARERTDFAALLLRPLRVPRPDHDLVARPDEPARHREPEVTCAADDCDPHAGTAPNADLGEPTARVVVAHERSGHDRPNVSEAVEVVCVGLVHDERVYQPLVTTCYMPR